MPSSSRRCASSSRRSAAGILLLSLASGSLAGETAFTLTVLHNNDGESQLIDAGKGLENFGGAARFLTVANQLRSEAALVGGSIMLSSGDNFLAGPEFNASLANGVPFYDTIAMDLIGYDAACIGNHEFDFGPQTLADFLSGFTGPVPFLSANLDFSGEPALQDLVDQGRIASRAVVTVNGELIGIVGATTPDLPIISSPGNVGIDSDVAAEVQQEVDALEARGVNKIILISHLQGITVELALATQLSGVDILIAGGGDELLANPDDLLVPDDVNAVFGAYPLTAVDADGNTTYVITTKGNYRYVGRLIATFSADGQVESIDEASGPVRVAGGEEPDAVEPDAAMLAAVTGPVAAALEGLATNIIAQTEPPLDGLFSSIRFKETNEGNLVADSMLWQAQQLAAAFGAPEPDIAIQNAGGIRNDSIIPAGPISELLTFEMLPFLNFVCVVPEVPAEQLLAILENAVSRVAPPPGFPTGGTGRFAQIAGFSLAYAVDAAPGSRVVEVTLDGGTVLVSDGAVVEGAPTVNVATINFLATGGDGYPFNGAPFVTLGATYQQMLFNYLVDELGGQVTAAQYPEGGEGRITRIDNPADIDNNSVINGADLGQLLLAFGPCSESDLCPADLNDDNVVDGQDIGILLLEWSFF
jgi:5'-nucleotidase